MKCEVSRIVEQVNDREYLATFLEAAQTATTANMNQSQAAALVHLALSIQESTSGLSQATNNLTSELLKSSEQLVEAMRLAAETSTRQARRLVYATWTLVAVTAGLILTAIGQLSLSWMDLQSLAFLR